MVRMVYVFICFSRLGSRLPARPYGCEEYKKKLDWVWPNGFVGQDGSTVVDTGRSRVPAVRTI